MKLFFKDNWYLKLASNPICRTNSSAITLKEDKKNLFPFIKQKYPPGKWNLDFDETSAWAINDYSNKLLALPSAKEKLENLAGEKPTLLWLVKATTDRVKALEFYKFITRTNVLNSLPDCFAKLDISNHLNNKEFYVNIFMDEFKYFKRKDTIDFKIKESITKHYAIGNLVRNILSRTTNISRNCTFDEKARIETFWRVSGFIDDKAAKGTWDVAKLKNGIDAGFLQFQFHHKANYQIRSKQPLPEFLAVSDSECNEKVALSPEYSPHIIGLESIEDRPISVSGHWIGSNYPFSIGCVHLMGGDEEVSISSSRDEQIVDEAEVQFAMATCYASCRAQAANHGFNDFQDITYPIATKCLLLHKNKLRLFAYQLNTMQVWNTANPLNNVLWTSPAIPLYETTEIGNKLTDAALEHILKFVCLQVQDRGIDYQPYVLAEEKIDSINLKINKKGEEVIDHPPVERFKYPRYSVYYRTFI